MKKIFNYLFIIFISLSLLFSSGCRRSSQQGGNGRVPVPSSKVNESTPNTSESDKEEVTKDTPSTDKNSQSSNKENPSKNSATQSTPNGNTQNNNGQTPSGSGSSGTGNNTTAGNNSTSNNNGSNNNANNNNNSADNNNSTVNSGSLPSIPNNYGYEFSSEVEDKILALINSERSNAGVVNLSVNSTLRSAARYKANEMLQYDYFSHSSPYTNQPSDIAKAYGHSFKTFGENLFSISSSTRSSLRENISAERIVAEWMASEGHRSNILNGNYRKTGIGVVIGNNGKCYISQMFSD